MPYCFVANARALNSAALTLTNLANCSVSRLASADDFIIATVADAAAATATATAAATLVNLPRVLTALSAVLPSPFILLSRFFTSRSASLDLTVMSIKRSVAIIYPYLFLFLFLCSGDLYILDLHHE